MTYGRPYLEYRVVETGGDAGSDDARSALLPCRERARHVARTRICPGNWKVLIFVCWWIYAKIKMSFGKGERRPDPAREIQFSCNDTEKAQETHGMRCQKAHIDLLKRRSLHIRPEAIYFYVRSIFGVKAVVSSAELGRRRRRRIIFTTLRQLKVVSCLGTFRRELFPISWEGRPVG